MSYRPRYNPYGYGFGQQPPVIILGSPFQQDYMRDSNRSPRRSGRRSPRRGAQTRPSESYDDDPGPEPTSIEAIDRVQTGMWMIVALQLSVTCIAIVDPIYRKKILYFFDYIWIILNIVTYVILFVELLVIANWQDHDTEFKWYLVWILCLIYGAIELFFALSIDRRLELTEGGGGTFQILGVAKSAAILIALYFISQSMPQKDPEEDPR